jgi:hypothetical protein
LWIITYLAKPPGHWNSCTLVNKWGGLKLCFKITFEKLTL